MLLNNILVLGASITASPWLTWKDFLEIETNLPVRDLSTKGVGNEFMAVSLMREKELKTGTLVVIMMTNVDKFDWYVEGAAYHQLEKQKHQPIAISANSGFWCTGSWFPDKKNIFRENFYSLDYFCSKSIQQILIMQNICQQRGATLRVLFDSPIWKFTEQDINDIGANELSPGCSGLDFLKLPLTRQWAEYINDDLKNNTGLIGYCWEHGLDWYSPKLRGHPPSGSHWAFYTNVIKPALSQIVDFQDHATNLATKIEKFNEIWHQY